MKEQVKLVLAASAVVGFLLAGLAAMAFELSSPWPEQGTDHWTQLTKQANVAPANTFVVDR